MTRRAGSSILYLILAPLPAVAMGALVMARVNVAAAVRMQNLLAALIGIVVAVAWVARDRRRARADGRGWLLPLGAIALLAPLAAPGLESVHRWLPVGPLRFHVAAVLIPAMLIAFQDVPRRRAVVFGLLTVGVLAAQPDFAQPPAFATAWGVFMLIERRERAALGVIAVMGVAAIAWFRPDPLEPVPHVEGVLSLAFSQHTALGIVSLASLAVVPAALLVLAERPHGLALASYFAVATLVTSLGHYPVPFLGHGVSPILGYYLGVAMLRSSPPTERLEH